MSTLHFQSSNLVTPSNTDLYQVQLLQDSSLSPCVALLSIFNCPFSVNTIFKYVLIINFMTYIVQASQSVFHRKPGKDHLPFCSNNPGKCCRQKIKLQNQTSQPFPGHSFPNLSAHGNLPSVSPPPHMSIRGAHFVNCCSRVTGLIIEGEAVRKYFDVLNFFCFSFSFKTIFLNLFQFSFQSLKKIYLTM